MEDAYLTQGKMPLLNAPGERYAGIYYSTKNSTVDDIETLYKSGIYSQTLPSLPFGSTNYMLINNTNFIGKTVLYLELYPPTTAAGDPNDAADADSTLQTNTFIPPGWGYNAIDYIEWTVGSSNSPTRIDGHGIWSMVAAQCKSAEHRNELWRLGGEFLIPNIGDGQPQPRVRALVHLPLPWSRTCDGLPLPADMVANPVNLTIKFRDRDLVIGGTGVKKSRLHTAQLSIRQAEIDRSKSLKVLAAADPSIVYSYPQCVPKFYQSVPIGGAPGSIATVSIQNIENADMLGMAFMLVRTDDLQGPVLNPMVSSELANLSVSLNGNFYYRCSSLEDMFKLFNMDGPQEASYWINQRVLSSPNSPYNVEEVKSYFTYVDFSRYRAACLPGDIPNVPRYSTQQFVVQFNVPPRRVTDITDPTYILLYTYFYTGMISFQGGVTTVYTA